MARPIEFNRQQVIEKSLAVFRQKGYNGTSMRDLEAATGLNPGSFYSAFGNKHEFFIETLRHFYQGVLQSLDECLMAESNPLVGLRQFFDKVVFCAVKSDKAERCCFAVKSALELALVDERTNQMVNAYFMSVEESIHKALALAQQKAFLPRESDVSILSKLIVNTLYGLNVESLLNPDQEKLEKMVELLFSSLLPQPRQTAEAV